MTPRPIGLRAAALGVLAVGCAGSLVVEYPGTLVYDSLLQLLEGRNASFGFWHPAVMSWLLGISDRLGGDARAFMVVQTLTGFAALAGLLICVRRVGPLAVACAALICLTPQILMYQGYILKDVLFADAILAGFVCLALAARFWKSQTVRWATIVMAICFLALAALARQNGIVYVPLAAGSLFWIARKNAGTVRGSLTKAAILAGGVALLVCVGQNLLARHGETDANAAAVEAQFKILRVFDLTGMRHADPDKRFTVLEEKAPDLAAALYRDGSRLYTPAKNDTLAGNPAISVALENTDADIVAQQWRQTVRNAPGAWLTQRAEVFAWVFLPTHRNQCHPFYVGVHGGADSLTRLGMHERNDARDRRLMAYATAWTPAFTHPIFTGLAIGILILLLIRRRSEDIAVAGLLGGALLFSTSFFAIAIACDYRYLYVLDLSALAATLYWCASPSPTAAPKPASRQTK